jgi:hypothetical protein
MLEAILMDMIINHEVTFITKKNRKEFKVYVSDIQDNGKTFVGWYTNRYNKLDIKRFNMDEYDYCL